MPLKKCPECGEVVFLPGTIEDGSWVLLDDECPECGGHIEDSDGHVEDSDDYTENSDDHTEDSDDA